jgi:hypothetical protein
MPWRPFTRANSHWDRGRRAIPSRSSERGLSVSYLIDTSWRRRRVRASEGEAVLTLPSADNHRFANISAATSHSHCVAGSTA